MYESDAVDQLRRLLTDLDSIEEEVLKLEKARIEQHENTRSKILILLARLEPNIHKCNRLICHFSRPISQEKGIDVSQTRIANLRAVENMAKRLGDIVQTQNEIVSEFTREQLLAQIRKMPREAVQAELKALRYQFEHKVAGSSSSSQEYILLLESRLAYLEVNEP